MAGKRKSTPLNEIKSRQKVEMETKNKEESPIDDRYEEEESEYEDDYEEYVQFEDKHVNTEEVQQPVKEQVNNNNQVSSFFNIQDVQLVIAVVIIFILVTIIPTKKLFEHYVAVDKIPFGDMIIKAVLSGILVFICIKFIL